MHPSRLNSWRLAILASFALFLVRPAQAAAQASISRSDASLALLAAPQTLRSNEVTLVWNRAPGESSHTEYKVVCGKLWIGTTSATHFTAKNLEPAHRYVFHITAVSHSGLHGRRSPPLRVTTPAREPVVAVEAYGAIGDGRTLNTKALQAAIDACPPGGVVLLSKGTYLSGALFLKGNMTLQIDREATLQGSASAADYEPLVRNRFEGWEMDTYASLLNAGTLNHAGPCTVHHLSIRGAGRIAGGGEALAKAMIAARGLRSRGRLICLMNCANVEVQGLTLEDSPSWTLHTIYSENITCHDLTLRSRVRNGDGLDPDSCRNAYIFGCSFDTGDDCIAIKSGKNPEGNVINRPTEGVRIFDCRFLRGHGISIGSETSGGIRDVLVEDCVAGDLLNGLQIKSTKDRGNVVEDVTVRNCDLRKITILTALAYNNDGAPAPEPPTFRNFRFVDIDLSSGKPSSPIVIADGFSAPGHRTRGLLFENLRLPAGAIVQVDQVEDARFVNVSTSDGAAPTYQITRSEGVVH